MAGVIQSGQLVDVPWPHGGRKSLDTLTAFDLLAEAEAPASGKDSLLTKVRSEQRQCGRSESVDYELDPTDRQRYQAGVRQGTREHSAFNQGAITAEDAQGREAKWWRVVLEVPIAASGP